MKKIIATLLVSASIASPFAAQAQGAFLGAGIGGASAALVATVALVSAVNAASNH